MLRFIRRHLIACAVLAAGIAAAGYAWAQSAGGYPIASPAGTEQIKVYSGSSPVINTVTINQLRNATGYMLTSTAAGAVSPAMTLAADNVIFTAALTGAVSLPLPASPPDGYIMSVVNGTSAAFTQTVTLSTTDGSTFANGNTAASLAAAGSQEWQYAAASKIWYRMR
jgi:hypothetical protein